MRGINRSVEMRLMLEASKHRADLRSTMADPPHACSLRVVMAEQPSLGEKGPMEDFAEGSLKPALLREKQLFSLVL